MAAAEKADEWATRQQLANDLRLSVQRIDQLRTQFGNRFERKDGAGPRAKVLICKPDWLRLWARAESSRSSQSDDEKEFFGDEAGWQDKCWEEKYYALRDERAKRHERIIWRDDVHQLLTATASKIRSLGEKLQHRFGIEAQDLVNDTLDDIVHQSEAYLTNGDSGTRNDSPAGVAGRVPG